MRRTVPAVLSVLALSAIAGCSSTSFVSQGYDDFTAYYNKFYNAQRSFKEADKRQSAVRTIDRELVMLVFPIADRAGSSSDYENSIRKSADVLRGHENSKWVDNALMLIGRAYFNQQNFVSAEQKFREVMALDTKLRDEARYWLARSQIAGNQYDAAHANLEAALSDDRISRKWRPFLHLALGELYVREGDYESATESLTEGLRVRDKTLAARAQFLLGQVYEKLGDYDTAVEMYSRVRKFKPTFEIAYAAQVRAIEVAAVHGDWQSAERALRKMERDDKNYANRHDLAVVRAKLFSANNDYTAAISTLIGVLRSSDPPQPQVRGSVHYTLAQIYRDELNDFARAAAHFDTAATALQSQIVQRRSYGTEHAIRDPFAPGAIVDVIEERSVFQAFSAVSRRVGRMDSLLTLGTMEEDEFRTRVEEIRQIRIAELEEEDRRLEQQNIEGQFSAQSSASNRGGLPEGKVLDYDPDADAAGFLSHKEPVRVQEAFQLFRSKWGDRPLVPGWRVSASITGSAQPSAIADSTLLGQVSGNGADRYANITIDVSAVPRSKAAQQRMRAERAIARYEMGNVLFLSMDLPDSAAVWYQLTIDEDSAEPVAARAHYALAELYRSLGQVDRAEELMADMARLYPDVDPTIIEEEEAADAGDALLEDDGADAGYNKAFAAWEGERYPSALIDMLHVASNHPRTTAAPRALLAVGTIAGDWARRDSIDLLDPLPVSLTDSLAAAFGWLVADTLSDSTQVDLSANIDIDQPSDAIDIDQPSDAEVELKMPPVDSVAAVARDTLSVNEVLSVSDSTVVSDSVAVSDSASVQDMSAVEVGVRPSVTGVYEYLTTTYASHPAAVQARATLKELAARRDARKAFADSVANVLALEAAAKLAHADSLARLDATSTIDSMSTAGLAAADDSLGSTDSFVTVDSTGVDSTGVVSNDDAASGSPSGLASDSNELPNGRSDSTVVFRPGFPVRPQADPDVAAGVPVKGVAADSAVVRVPDTRPAATIVDDVDVDEAPVLVGGEAELFSRMELEQFDESISGTISVSFVVGADGKVAQVTVVKGLSEIVDREITRALYQSRFQPGMKDGRIVAVRVKRDFDIAVD